MYPPLASLAIRGTGGQGDISPLYITNMSKKISEGAYGCIYKPAVGINGKVEPKYINKIQIAKKETENEPRLGKQIQTIPHYRRYFAPSIQVSNLVVSAIDKQELKECKVIAKQPKRKIVASKIPYVGENTLGEQIEKFHQALPATTFSRIKQFHNHIKQAIQKLQDDKIGIVHNDIKQNNIVYSNSLQCPILIDFGLSFNIHELETPQQIETAFLLYDENDAPSAVDITCIGKITNHSPNWGTKKIDFSLIENTIHKIYNENPVYKIIRHYLGDQQMAKQEQKKKQYYKQIMEHHNYKGAKVVDELLENWKQWDQYSANVMILKQIHLYYQNPKTDPKAVNQYREKLIRGILSP